MKHIFDYTEEEILSIFEANNNIRIDEKNKLGEVFTPLSLINELLDALPSSVWTNENLKWLDPAAGFGQFSSLIYIRLLKTLEKKIPELRKRKEHILKNMLYMVELNSKSVKRLKQFFGSSANIIHANFLTDFTINETFDIVIGNPPFQSPKQAAHKGGAGKNILWDKFVVSILTSHILKAGGHLAFITPAMWRRPESDLYELMTRKNKLSFLHIYGKSDGIKLFGIQSRFDLYVIEKVDSHTSIPDYKTRLLIDELSNRHTSFPILSWPFLPNYEFDTIKKIMVPLEKGIPVIFDSSYYYYAHPLKNRQSEKYKYPVVHGIVADGLIIKYSDSKNPEQIGVKKLLLNFNERQYPYVDIDGKYGMSQLTFGIPISSKEQGERIKTAILSPRFQKILDATKWGAFQTDYRMFKYFDPNFRESAVSLTKRRKHRSVKTRKIRN
jgi:hypothetical protein